MAGDTPRNPAKALECKERGNRCFQAGDWAGAEKLYSEALSHDSENALLYTNRCQALLKFPPSAPTHHKIIADATRSIELTPINLKAFYFRAQAQIALGLAEDALKSAREAHRLCVDECCSVPPGKGANNIRPLTDLVLRCKKEAWTERETARVAAIPSLLSTLLPHCPPSSVPLLESIFESASTSITASLSEDEAEWKKRPNPPDWLVDGISFKVMLDPVITKTGNSYERASLMEYFKRSQTDPLTRAELGVKDLRPNLGLREAGEEWLEQNGWAVDW